MKYFSEFRLNLEYKNLGFNSITEFVASMPEIFKIFEDAELRRIMIIDVRKSVANLRKLKKKIPNLQNEILPLSDNDSKPIPSNCVSNLLCKN